MTPVYKFSTARSIVGPNTYYSSMLAENSVFAPIPPSAYDLLQTYTLDGPDTSVTFSSLDSTYSADYQHLQIRMITRSDRPTGSNTNLDLVINGDTGANYAFHQIYRTSNLGGGGIGSQNRIYLGPTAQPASGTDIFGGTIVDILDPFDGNKNTTTRALGGFSTGAMMFTSGLWNNTNSVTSLEIICEPSNNFVAGSRFSLYGLRGA